MPLRVLIAADVDPARVIGGAERILREHAARLAARGHRITVLTRAGEQPPGEAEVEGFRVVRHPVTGSGPLLQLRSVLREGGEAFAALRAREQFDLIDVHQPLAGWSVLRRPESRGLPVVYTYLSPWADEYRTRARRNGRAAGLAAAWTHLQAGVRSRIERDCVARTDRFLVLSRFSRAQLEQLHGVDPSRVVLLPGAADTGRFRPPADRAALRERLGVGAGDELLLTVRNLVPRMGLDGLLEATAVLARRRPTVRLWIGGSGPLRESLERQAAALGLEDRVRFLGFVPEEALPEHYGAADLFVLPTRALEGFGLVTVEALACGTPVVGTPVGGTEEILSGLDPSLLFPGMDPDSMAGALEDALNRLRQEAGLRDRCREFAENRYSWQVVTPALEAALEAVAGGGR